MGRANQKEVTPELLRKEADKLTRIEVVCNSRGKRYSWEWLNYMDPDDRDFWTDFPDPDMWGDN